MQNQRNNSRKINNDTMKLHKTPQWNGMLYSYSYWILWIVILLLFSMFDPSVFSLFHSVVITVNHAFEMEWFICLLSIRMSLYFCYCVSSMKLTAAWMETTLHKSNKTNTIAEYTFTHTWMAYSVWIRPLNTVRFERF